MSATPPEELVVSVHEFWPEEEWENALSVSRLESGWNAFAVDDTTSLNTPCGTRIATIDGVGISAEVSVGYFQINACNFPTWDWRRLYNARHNAGTAHLLWEQAGRSWSPWYFSAKALGILHP